MAPFQFIKRHSPYNSKLGKTLPVFAVTQAHIEIGAIEATALEWARKSGFKAETGSVLLVPSADGSLGGALFGLGKNPAGNPFMTGHLARALPEGEWHIETAPLTATRIALGFGLGSYSFETYLKPKPQGPTLLIPKDANATDIKRQIAGVFLARDLINTPTNDMGPNALEKVFRDLGEHYEAKVSVISGDDLLKKNFPLIHAVGRAAAERPGFLNCAGGRRVRRRSPWSARASPSTPAASTSSPRLPCC